ncbi:MAG: PIN domain-containing protein [Cyanobacteria bacterium P01_G01_bin.19]
MEYGLLKKPNLKQAYGQQLDLLYRQINHLDFDRNCALCAANIKQRLINAGTPIGIEDVLIAASALHHNFTVVTSNIKHFEKIEDLEIVNWKS